MHDDLTPDELEALRALPREALPSDLLEERTVQALQERHWIRRRRVVPTPLAWSAAAAACLVFFVAGFAVGQNRGNPDPRQAAPKAPSATVTDTEGMPHRDSTDVTLAEPSTKRGSGVQHVVWF